MILVSQPNEGVEIIIKKDRAMKHCNFGTQSEKKSTLMYQFEDYKVKEILYPVNILMTQMTTLDR